MFARSLDLDATSTFEDEILTRFSEVCDTHKVHTWFSYLCLSAYLILCRQRVSALHICLHFSFCCTTLYKDALYFLYELFYVFVNWWQFFFSD